MIVAWLSNYVARLANDLSLITSKFDLQIVSSYFLSVFLVTMTNAYQSALPLQAQMLKAFAFFAARSRAASDSPPPIFLPSLPSVNFTCHSGWGVRYPTCSRYRLVRYTFPILNRTAIQPPALVNLALYLLLDRGTRAVRTSATRASWAIALLTFAAVVIRLEIAGLLGLLSIQLLTNGSLSLTRLVKVGIISGLISIGMRLRSSRVHTAFIHAGSVALTVSIDSYFWDQWPLWPEFSSIYFNVYEGKSADWGVSIPLTLVVSSRP
jgi:hypothetical protein